jgi:hypothetical protein
MTRIVKRGSEELQIKYSDIIDVQYKLVKDHMGRKDL